MNSSGFLYFVYINEVFHECVNKKKYRYVFFYGIPKSMRINKKLNEEICARRR